MSSVLELLGIDLDALLDGVLSESGILGNILSNIGPVLSPVLTALDTALIGPLSELLGLEVAGADLYGRGATCGHPALRG